MIFYLYDAFVVFIIWICHSLSVGGLLNQLRRLWTARALLLRIIFLRSPSTKRMNTRDPFICAIHHRNNKRTLRRALLKDYKMRKKNILYVLLGNPLLLARAIECLKHCNRIRAGSGVNGGGLAVQWGAQPGAATRCRMSDARRPRRAVAPPRLPHLLPPTYDIAFLFHNFYTIESLQRRRVKTMIPEVETARKPFISKFIVS